jgi:divalent metal cation (Fe/Co/Zn/Cd) transporter
LKVLYEEGTGTKVSFDSLLKLAGPRLDPSDIQRLMNIIASPAGLLGQGLIDCHPLRGNNLGQTVIEIRGIELTAVGKKYVEDRKPSSRRRAWWTWAANTATGAIINTLAGLLVGSIFGWFLRGWIKP